LERQAWSGQGASLLIFLEVFRITLTPLTIALGIEPGARACRVHRLVPQPAAMDDPGSVAVAPGQEARR
jgi:multicomponent Na+:H+ antiporter subunit E